MPRAIWTRSIGPNRFVRFGFCIHSFAEAVDERVKHLPCLAENSVLTGSWYPQTPFQNVSFWGYQKGLSHTVTLNRRRRVILMMLCRLKRVVQVFPLHLPTTMSRLTASGLRFSGLKCGRKSRSIKVYWTQSWQSYKRPVDMSTLVLSCLWLTLFLSPLGAFPLLLPGMFLPMIRCGVRSRCPTYRWSTIVWWRSWAATLQSAVPGAQWRESGLTTLSIFELCSIISGTSFYSHCRVATEMRVITLQTVLLPNAWKRVVWRLWMKSKIRRFISCAALFLLRRTRVWEYLARAQTFPTKRSSTVLEIFCTMQKSEWRKSVSKQHLLDDRPVDVTITTPSLDVPWPSWIRATLNGGATVVSTPDKINSAISPRSRKNLRFRVGGQLIVVKLPRCRLGAKH